MDNINFLLYTIGKSIVTLREIIILCREGFPDGALALARNLFEQFVHVLYIEQREGSESFDSLLEKYYVNYNVQRTKALMFAAVNIDNSFEQSRLCQDELNEIRKKYGVKKLIDYWWCDVNSFSEMCEVVCRENISISKLIRKMQLLYKRACLTLHSSSMGNRIRIGSNFQGIDMGKWDSGQEVALSLAVNSMIQIVGCVYDKMGLNYKRIIKELRELALYYMNYTN